MAAASQLKGLTRATTGAGAGFGFGFGAGAGAGDGVGTWLEAEKALMTGLLEIWQLLTTPTAGFLPKKLLVQLTVPMIVR